MSLALLASICATYTWAQESRTKELDRVKAASTVLNEIMATPDKGIPQEILAAADCAVVVPSMLKGGLVFGARYGRGIATCRTAAHGANHWSAPAPIRIEGGSWGLQIGGQAVDLVMLVMNEKGMQHLLNSKFQVGVDASAAAGPVGRHAEAGTDWKMRSELLTYSRSRGAFAGITLNGAVVKQDTDDTLALYGKEVPFQQILTGKVPPPAGTQTFLAEVHKYFGESKAVENERREASAEPTSSKTSAHNESAQAGGTTGAASTPASSAKSETGSTGNVGSATQSNSQSTGTTTEQTNTPNTAAATGSKSSDQVRSSIQSAFQNTPNLSTNNVSVNVTDSEVVLAGSVPNESDRATIRRLAEQNAGGRRVVDNLAVK